MPVHENVSVSGVATAKEMQQFWENVSVNGVATPKEILNIWENVNVNGVATPKLIYTSFTPIDMTFSTPGTYTLNIGKATEVRITGRGADGGGGGGGGQGSLRGRLSSLRATTNTGGDGGSGGPGADGADGQDGRSYFQTPFYRYDGGAGGGGEAGESGGDTTVTYGSTTLRWRGGRGGNGGNGGDAEFWRNSLRSRGGSGGVAVGGITSTARLSNGGTGGDTLDTSQVTIDGTDGGGGYSGENPGERLYTDIPADTILTIVVGSKGSGGDYGNGGRQPAGRGSGENGTAGSAGTNDGSVRIVTARSGSVVPETPVTPPTPVEGDAEAPTATIAVTRTGQGRATAVVSVTGGKYDTIAYAWSLSTNPLIQSGQGTDRWNVIMANPGTYTFTCRVTVTGDGTNANANTEATVDATLVQSF